MHISHEDFIHLIQFPQKVGIFTVETITTHPGKINPSISGRTHHLKGQIMFAKIFETVGRNPRLLTPFPIFDPRFGKKQSAIDGRCMPAMAQNSKYGHLAIVHFTEGAAPLPADTDRFFPFLRNTGFIDQQALIFAQRIVGALSHMANDGIGIPRGVGQKILQCLFIGFRHCLGHPLHVLLLGLHQSFEVPGSVLAAMTGFCLKMVSKAIEIICKIICYPPKGAVVMVKSFLNSVDVRAGCCDLARPPIDFFVSWTAI
jgi:hypothetical protein